MSERIAHVMLNLIINVFVSYTNKSVTSVVVLLI